MLDPAAARNQFADDLVAEYQRLELILLELIADKISRGLDAPDWAQRQVMELQRFRREASIIAAKMAGKSPELIASAIQRAVTDGFLAASQDIATAEGLSAGQVVANAGTVPAIDGPAIAALLAETTGALTAVDRGVLRMTDDIYQKVVARGAATVVAGAETRKAATQRALNEFTRNGITGFLDRRGKSWSLTAYTEMAIRTGTTKALMQSHSDRLTERGYDLVIVSSHPRPAPQCQPYERQILSLSGRTAGVISETSRTTGRTVTVKVKASLAEAESRGLHHPNCRHRHSLFVPGVTDTSPTKADDEGYEDTQKLRYMERQTREWKRRAATALDPAEKKAANAKVREWQGKIKAHTETTGVGRRRDREQLNLGNKIPTLDTAKVPTPKKPIPKPDTSAADTKAWLDAETKYKTDVSDWLGAEKKYTGDVKKWLAAEKVAARQAAEKARKAAEEAARVAAAKKLPLSFTREEGKAWATKVWNYTRDSSPFTVDELKAISGYSGFEYDDWNTVLRKQYQINEPLWRIGITNLDSAMKKTALVPEPVVVTRTLDGVAFDGIDKADARSLEGRDFLDRGFMSTAVEAEGKGVFADDPKAFVMRLTVPKGARAIYISQPGRMKDRSRPLSLSAQGDSENELILDRGSRFRVTKVVPNADPSLPVEVYAELVEQITEPLREN